MEQEHRNRIRSNIEKLMEFTEYDELMEACLKHQLLFDSMRDQIEVRIIIHDHAYLSIHTFFICEMLFHILLNI